VTDVDLLTFHVEGTPYALPLAAVAEVVASPAVRPVPKGPAGVLGVAEAGGRVVAVLDLAFLLGEQAPASAPEHLVRLAPPHDRSALAVGNHIGTGRGTPVPGRERVLVAGVPHILLDAAQLLARAARSETP
jgi:chemotaxis protein histidine kinase CheA